MRNYDGPVRTMLDRFSSVWEYVNAVPVSWGLAVANNEIPNVAPLYINGRDDNCDTVNFYPVWNPSIAYTWAIADQRPWVQSTNLNDTLAGSGAQIVRVIGLTSAGAVVSEDVRMNGLAAVQLNAATFRRVNSLEVIQAGATGQNEGTITCYWTDAATRFFSMSGYEASRGTTAVQTVPAGKRDFIAKWLVAGMNARHGIVYRESTATPWKMLGTGLTATNAFEVNFDFPIVFAAGTDYYCAALGIGGNQQVRVSLLGWRENA